MDKHKIREWIIYISMGIVVIWLILKSVGIIQTPFWLEYGIPISSFILGFLAFYRDFVEKLHEVIKSLAVLTNRVDHIEKDVSHLKTDMTEVKEKMKNIEIKISL